MAVADPELLVLFEDWLDELENEVVLLVKERGPVSLTELARKLTVDKAGNDATNAKFDPKNVKQFGFFEQWTDARGLAAMFLGGLPYDVNNMKNAVIPDAWKQAWKW